MLNVSSHLEEEMMVEVCTGMDMESEDQSSVWKSIENNVKIQYKLKVCVEL